MLFSDPSVGGRAVPPFKRSSHWLTQIQISSALMYFLLTFNIKLSSLYIYLLHLCHSNVFFPHDFPLWRSEKSFFWLSDARTSLRLQRGWWQIRSMSPYCSAVSLPRSSPSTCSAAARTSASPSRYGCCVRVRVCVKERWWLVSHFRSESF